MQLTMKFVDWLKKNPDTLVITVLGLLTLFCLIIITILINNIFLGFNKSSLYGAVIACLCIMFIAYIFYFLYFDLKIKHLKKENQYLNQIKEKEEIIDSFQKIKEEKTEKSTESNIDITALTKDILLKINAGNMNTRTICENLLQQLAKTTEIVMGMIFLSNKKNAEQFDFVAGYAYYAEEKPASFLLGEGISGQVAKDKTELYISDLPDNYITIFSGLGNSHPRYLLIVPIIHKDMTIAVMELAFFKALKKGEIALFTNLAKEFAPIITNLDDPKNSL